MKRIMLFGLMFLFCIAVCVGCGRQKEDKIGRLEIKEEGVPEEQVVSAPAETVVPAPPLETELQPPSKEKIAPLVNESVATATQAVQIGTGVEWNKKIQTALKNAGFYNGAIDGKLGPMSKNAIEEFQKSKGLKVDGKVGPSTWGELEKSLVATPQPVVR